MPLDDLALCQCVYCNQQFPAGTLPEGMCPACALALDNINVTGTGICVAETCNNNPVLGHTLCAACMKSNKLLHEMQNSLTEYQRLTGKGRPHSVIGSSNRSVELPGSSIPRGQSPPPPPPPPTTVGTTVGKSSSPQTPARTSVGPSRGAGLYPNQLGPAHTSVDLLAGYNPYLGMNMLTPALHGVGQQQFSLPLYANALGPAQTSVDQSNFGIRNVSPLLMPAQTSVGQLGLDTSTPMVLQPGTLLGSAPRANQPGVRQVAPAPTRFYATQSIAPAQQVPGAARSPMAPQQSSTGSGNRDDLTSRWVLTHSPPAQEGRDTVFKVPPIPPYRGQVGNKKNPQDQVSQRPDIPAPKKVVLNIRRARSVVRSAPEARADRSSVSVMSEGRFHPVYEGDQSEVQPDDSVSQHAGSGQAPQQQGGEDEEEMQLDPVKQDFIDMIRRIAMKEKADPGEESNDSDPMKQYFGDTSGYYKDKPKKRSLSFSDQQKRILNDILHTSEPQKIDIGFKGKKQGVDYVDEDYESYLRPLELNESAQVYLKYVKTHPSGSNTNSSSNQKHTTPKSEGLKNQMAKEMAKDLEKIDATAKRGLRFAGFGQWLLTSQRILLEEELGTAHPLLQKDSALSRILVESFKTYNTLLSQFARISVLDSMSRRKLFMEEIAFDKIPKEQALKLPMDTNGKHLFGSSKDSEEKVTSFETIAPDYAKKLTAIRDARAALRDPKALSLPAGLPSEDSGKGAGKGGSAPANPPRKRKPKGNQGSGGGQNQAKRQRQSDPPRTDNRQQYQRERQYDQTGGNYSNSKNQPFRGNYGGGAGKGGGRRR